MPRRGRCLFLSIISQRKPNLVIRPSRGWRTLNLSDLWRYRELLYFLVWKDVKVRYKQTALGVAWAVLQPFLTMVIFSIFFGRLAGLPSDGLPYPVFVYCALLPWQLFAYSLTESSNSLVANQNLITKVYFPGSSFLCRQSLQVWWTLPSRSVCSSC